MSSESNSSRKTEISSAKKAYITSDGRYIEEPAEEVHEELKKPRQVAKKQEAVIPKKKAVEKSDFNKKREQEFEKLESGLEHENDIFDDDGNIIEDESEIKQKLKELEQKIEEGINRLLELVEEKIAKPLNKIKAKFLSLLSKLINPVTSLLIKFTTVFERVLKRNKPESSEEITESQPETRLIHGCFDDMLNLNIVLTDNYDAPLYKKRGVALAKTEEALILMGAVDAIKQCAEFTKGMPPVAEGYYQGREVSQIMENVQDEDVTLFLGYVKTRPQKYIAKSWKMSETFATWLVNNAPMAEENV